jgi:alginate O-acetyltransferase complex protein AlgJ
VIRFLRKSSTRPATAFGKIVPGQSGFELQGSVDLRTSTRIFGWVRDAAKPGARVQVVARTENEILSTGVADIHRPDLELAGIGDGCHAFELTFHKSDTDRVFIETVETAQVVPVAPYAIEDATPVHHGEDGWLFLRTGANNVEKFYTVKNHLTDDEIEQWCLILKKRKQNLTAHGISYFHMIAPDKITVYADKYGSKLPHYDSRPSLVLPSALTNIGFDDLYIDLSCPLMLKRDSRPLYWKTDTHWTYFGAAIAVQEICRALNLLAPDFSNGVFREYTATLDLGSVIEPPISEAFKVFEFSNPAKLIFANPLVAQSFAESPKYPAGLLHGCHVVYRNEYAPNSQKVALFGDSYCGVDQSLLTGLVAQTFREVHFFWSNSIDYGYIAEIKPDIVLSELAERFVKRVPDDERDLRSFAVTQHAAFTAKRDALQSKSESDEAKNLA